MKKKIWIWNHYASDMYRNEGGRHYWFAENLIKKGYEVTIFCSNTFHNSSDVISIDKNTLFKTDIKNNIRFIFIRTSSFDGNGLDRIRNMADFYKNIKKVSNRFIKKQDKPDVILASSVHPLTMLAGVQIGKKHDIPCISEVRDLWPEAIFQFGYAKESSLIGRALTQGEKYIYDNSDAIIFTKPGDKDYLIEKKWTTEQGGSINLEKVFYINNGLDIEEYNNQIQNYIYYDEDLDSDKFKVIYTGTIKPVNNIDLILDAAKILRDNEEFVFLLFGSGSEMDRIKNRIEKEKIINVKLKGRVDKKYIPNILSKSSVNLLNYSQDQYNWKRGNSSNKLFEYMASGKPIISTVKMGYSFIEKYQCGIELDENNSQSLADGIRNIYNLDTESYDTYSTNAEQAAEDFDMKVLTEKLINIINKILQ